MLRMLEISWQCSLSRPAPPLTTATDSEPASAAIVILHTRLAINFNTPWILKCGCSIQDIVAVDARSKIRLLAPATRIYLLKTILISKLLNDDFDI